MDHDMVNVGTAIIKSVDILESAAKETESLLLRTFEKLKEHFGNHELIKPDGLQLIYNDEALTESAWVFKQSLRTYKLIGHGKKNHAYGFLSILADLRPDHNLYPNSNQPLFHVIYTSNPKDVCNKCSDFMWDWSQEGSYELDVHFDRLQLYNNYDGVNNQWWNIGWAYSLPLTAVRNVEDVERLIVNPVIRLLEETNENPFRDTPEIISMQAVDSAFVPV